MFVNSHYKRRKKTDILEFYDKNQSITETEP